MRGDMVALPSTLFDKTSRWFERAHAALLNDLPCRRGCSHCCLGLFPITLLDQQELQRGLQSLPEEQRRAIEDTAALQVKMIEESAPKLIQNRFIDHWPDPDIDSIVERYRALPCPALDSDGSCGLYAFRPLACRSMGIPSETEGIVQGACAVQTSTPLIQLPLSLRQEEDRLAKEETCQLMHLQHENGAMGEELLLPYAFLPDSTEEPTGATA